MKADEQEFFQAIYAQCNNGYLKIHSRQLDSRPAFPRRLIESGKYGNAKRLMYLLEKWTVRGWYEYGVSLDLGWLTPEGIKQVTGKEIIW